MIISLADEIVAEFVEEEELSFGVAVICFRGIKKLVWRGKLEAFALGDLELGVVFSELLNEILHRGNSLELQRRSHSAP